MERVHAEPEPSLARASEGGCCGARQLCCPPAIGSRHFPVSYLHAAALFLLLCLPLAVGVPAVRLSGCTPGGSDAWLCTVLVPSPTLSCQGAPVYFSTWTAGWGSLAAVYRRWGEWQLVVACSTRELCFGGGNTCTSESETFRSQAGSADLARLGSFSGGITVTPLPEVAGFACAPSNDPAQCAVLATVYDVLQGDAWSANSGWRAAAAGVATDFCTFHGVSCHPSDGEEPTWVALPPCAPYAANETSSATGNTTACALTLQPGFLYKFSTCGLNPGDVAERSGDTVLRLQNADGIEVAYNDDFFSSTCGSGSAITYALDGSPGMFAGPQALTLQQGCFSSYACNATVLVGIERLIGGGAGTTVQSLALQWSGLDGTIPDEVATLTTLTYLNLGGNHVRGTIPSSLAQLQNLLTLTLGTNFLTGTLPEVLATLPLRDLGLDTLQLSGTMPAAFGALDLTYLGVRCSGLCGNLPVSADVRNDFHTTRETEKGTFVAVHEFFPSCSCELFSDNQGNWFCMNRRSFWSGLMLACLLLFVGSLFYIVWREKTRERGLAFFESNLRRVGCTGAAMLVASQSKKSRTVRKFKQQLAQEAATQPRGELVEFADADVSLEEPDGSFGFVTVSAGKPQRVSVTALTSCDVALLRAEARKLCSLRHANVVVLVGISVPRCLVLSTCTGYVMPLSAYVADGRMSFRVMLCLALDVTTGVAFLHTRGVSIVHGGLWAASVLLFSSDTAEAGLCARIADAGLATLRRRNAAYRPWQAPELLGGAQPTQRSDEYALGVTLWELFSRSCRPYPDMQEASLDSLQRAVAGGLRPRLSRQLPSAVRSMLAGCWAQRADDRISAAEAACTLKHLVKQKSAASGDVQLQRQSSAGQAPAPAEDEMPACPLDGLSLAALRAFIAEHSGEVFTPTREELEAWEVANTNSRGSAGPKPMAAPFEALTTGQVAQRIVKKHSSNAQTSYADMLRGQTDASGRPLVARATVFLSHAWLNPFKDLMDAVFAKLDGHADSHLVYVWNDIFVASQHKTETLPFSWWTDTFADAIRTVGRTLLVLQPWSNPVPLTRAWCLWEIFSSLRDDDDHASAASDARSCLNWRGLEIALPAAEEAQFKVALVNRFDDIVLSMNNIDARAATAFKETDEAQIKAAVEASPGGFEHVNTAIHDSLNAWLVRSGTAALEEAKQADNAASAPSLTTMKLYRNLSTLLREHGDAAQAHKLEKEAGIHVAALERALRTRLPSTSWWGLCPGVAAEERMSDSEISLLLVLNFKARLLYVQPGDSYEAADILRRELRRRTESISFGPAHPSTLRVGVDLAVALEFSMQEGGVLDILEQMPFVPAALVRQVLRPARNRLTHATNVSDAFWFVAISMLTLLGLPAVLLLGKLWIVFVAHPRWREEARALLQRDRAARQNADIASLEEEGLSALDVEQRRAAEQARGLYRGANIAHRSGRHAEAERMYEEALTGLSRTLGDSHPETLGCLLQLAVWLNLQGRRSTIIKTYGLFSTHYWPMLLSASKRRDKLVRAEALLRSALQTARNRLGNTHPKTVQFVHELARCLERQASQQDKTQYTLEAQMLAGAATDALTSALGENHARTVAARNCEAVIEMLHEHENIFVTFKARLLLYIFSAVGGMAVFVASLVEARRIHDPFIPMLSPLSPWAPACQQALL